MGVPVSVPQGREGRNSDVNNTDCNVFKNSLSLNQGHCIPWVSWWQWLEGGLQLATPTSFRPEIRLKEAAQRP
jgi:hypothetical protein